MAITRRAFWYGGIAGAAVVVAGRSVFGSQVQRFANPLQVPPVLEGISSPAGRVFDLVAGAGRSEFVAGNSTPTIGINAPYLGPKIRCRAEKTALNSSS
jgi:hypothetical protein